jgi:hypothetical protein
LKTRLFLATLRGLKQNIPAFSIQIREFSPRLEGRLIFPRRFNAFVLNYFTCAAVQYDWELDWWGGGV